MSETDDIHDEVDESAAPLLDHLLELRKRLLISLVALGIAFLLCLHFSRSIFAFLVQPLLRAGQGRLIYTDIFEAFFVDIKVAFFAAIMLAFPIVAMQIWRFIAPGLYSNEKRAFLPFLVMTPLLFLVGASMAYYVAMPIALHFLLGYQGNIGGVQQTALPAVGNYLNFVTKFIFGFGVAFLLPLVLLLLERAGFVTRQQLVAGRRYAIVASVAIAAVLTPPDIVSQLLLGVPLILLYEMALLAMLFGEKRRKKETDLVVAED
ncbi:twin-arginine translocase subunit TatC [Zymomonas mobilis subsp. mobilis ZM4 = ATCC 31821]|uniref:Sec-independent protein translocase protein TatC n=2 Tax=Zymomonas mobilis subsp. mobilis TaxID=120045 RepID=Q5NN68_ZYMMO|nr:twin-arginine translocase subunit TatC [Zymomonas mobilis]AAV89842.1 Sec-independent protein translocase, TatC subunit [Zymomonas mobilis subsp. mobilis ZM4 = ATCC 31821]ACV74669.1 Sec-independent protein translocase, TatC subunit [Zymomonas mobilis subsp. mobilis NCIMB 11163]AEH61969.1 Sec-independent protein translocase, TatC subunit [Zymomonas mobilis subsp. mobilis ATCC 10988]ART92638.1 twin-arginine translocase subunit TatC [Zymomonas mobilis subsp. mobilis]AVZ26097.1 twin-arginine tra